MNSFGGVDPGVRLDEALPELIGVRFTAWLDVECVGEGKCSDAEEEGRLASLPLPASPAPPPPPAPLPPPAQDFGKAEGSCAPKYKCVLARPPPKRGPRCGEPDAPADKIMSGKQARGPIPSPALLLCPDGTSSKLSTPSPSGLPLPPAGSLHLHAFRGEGSGLRIEGLRGWMQGNKRVQDSMQTASSRSGPNQADSHINARLHLVE